VKETDAPLPDPEAHRCCIVCGSLSAGFFAGLEGRRYSRCAACQATFLHPADRLSPGEERARYLLHRNDPGDEGYRRFLSRLAGPLLGRLAPRSRGLDYGCGPGPVLAGILREAGHRMNIYDPFFAPDPEPLGDTYDFVTCTEAAEHFHRPEEEFARLDSLLKPGGWLAVMTRFLEDGVCFASWSYRRDPTHVVFYRRETMRHIAVRYGWTCDFPAGDVALMQKPPDTSPTS
jgi:SAM-dependent methyltransferase